VREQPPYTAESAENCRTDVPRLPILPSKSLVKCYLSSAHSVVKAVLALT